MKTALKFSLFLIFLLYSSSALALDMTPVEKMTGDYLKLYQSGKPARACELYWNWDRFCKKTYGRDYEVLKNPARKKVCELMLTISTSIFLNEEVLSAMKQARFNNQCILAGPDGSIRFIFETVFPDGTNGGRTILYIENINGQPWFVDADMDGLLSARLSAAYTAVKDKMSLVSFLTMTRDEALRIFDQSNLQSDDWLYGTWELTDDPDHNEKDFIIFKKLGVFISKSPEGKDRQGFYRIANDKITLSLTVKGRLVETELIVSGGRAKLTNASGAYYTRIKKN
jgi:hypothetical protein